MGVVSIKSDMFIDLLKDNPVIAAVKDEEGLNKSLESDCAVVFILYGDLLSLGSVAAKIKNAGKLAIVHLDLIEGLAPKDAAVDFIAKSINADGIISTKPSVVHRAKSCGLLAIQRFFLLDSIALNNIGRQPSIGYADAIEILPGLMPKIIRRLVKTIDKPVIAGGLINDKEDIVAALEAGAVAISSTNHETWFM
jgi:glycerol-3-phosphate responsive antiterminator